MAFHHDTKSETHFCIGPRQNKPNGRSYTNSEKVLMREQMSNEGVGSNRRFKSREDGIEALSKTALNPDLFEVCQRSSLGYFTL